MALIGTSGGTVNVSRFKLYDIVSDRLIESKRLATLPTIERIGAIRVGPIYEVPYDDVDADGLTPVDYTPVRGK
jgi:hypothetical protein